MVGEQQVITPVHILGLGNPNFDKDFTGLDRDKVREAVLREQNNLPYLFRQSQERLAIFWKSLWDQYRKKLEYKAFPHKSTQQ